MIILSETSPTNWNSNEMESNHPKSTRKEHERHYVIQWYKN